MAAHRGGSGEKSMKIKVILLLICGILSLVIGSIGLVLPILPTTPFVLVSAACFAGSSPRLYQKLRCNKYFGEFVDNYQNKTGVTCTVKVRGLVFLWVTLSVSAFIFPAIHVRLILLVVGICVSLHILLLKNRSEK
ncbi:MAG: YbaN family protein [Anaerovoracaceae bacterium]